MSVCVSVCVSVHVCVDVTGMVHVTVPVVVSGYEAASVVTDRSADRPAGLLIGQKPGWRSTGRLDVRPVLLVCL